MSRARDFADLAGSADAGGISGSNVIINGAMQVAQRGGSATTGNRTVDRFLNTYGDATITQSQDTSVPSGEGFSNSYKHEVTSASSASGGFFGVLYRAEAQDIRNSGWDYTSASSSITLSFFAKASVAGTYMCGLQTHDGTGQVINTQYTLAADTWKKITATFPGNSNVTIDNDNGNGLTVFLLKEYGGAYTSGSTFDAWAAYSGGAQSPDANINLYDTANSTFFVTGVQLEVGEQATPFEHRSYADEYQKCLRYYWRWTANTAYDVLGNGGYDVDTTCLTVHSLPATMRTEPTISLTGSFQIRADATNFTPSSTEINRATPWNVELTHTVADNNLSGKTGRFRTDNDDDAFVEHTAEL